MPGRMIRLRLFLATILLAVFTVPAAAQELPNEGQSEAAYYAFALLSVPLTAVFVALAILLPASVTLTRIEAALLPEDQETIVPFDRSSVLGDLDLQTRGACRSVFVEAWKSFEPAARLRLIKLYVKMFSLQVAIAVFGGLAMLALM